MMVYLVMVLLSLVAIGSVLVPLLLTGRDRQQEGN